MQYKDRKRSVSLAHAKKTHMSTPPHLYMLTVGRSRVYVCRARRALLAICIHLPLSDLTYLNFLFYSHRALSSPPPPRTHALKIHAWHCREFRKRATTMCQATNYTLVPPFFTSPSVFVVFAACLLRLYKVSLRPLQCLEEKEIHLYLSIFIFLYTFELFAVIYCSK